MSRTNSRSDITDHGPSAPQCRNVDCQNRRRLSIYTSDVQVFGATTIRPGLTTYLALVRLQSSLSGSLVCKREITLYNIHAADAIPAIQHQPLGPACSHTYIDNMSTLLNQAPEVLHEIFKRAAPSDLASISSTCKFLNTFVTRDTLLWRQQYLAHFDLPAKTETEPNWQHLLKTNINIEKLLKSSDVSLKTEEALIRVVELASSLLQTATPSAVLNTAWLRRMFVHDESNISSFLCRSSLFRGARLGSNTPASTTALRQMSAKLQVFSGLDVEADCSRMDRPLGDVQLVHSYARARVYDLRRYKQANHWGPFTDDGTSAIDWEKVQAIMLDLCFNIRMYKTRRARPESTRYYSPARRGDLGIGPGFWDKPFWGLAPNSCEYSYRASACAPILVRACD